MNMPLTFVGSKPGFINWVPKIDNSKFLGHPIFSRETTNGVSRGGGGGSRGCPNPPAW